MSVAERSVDVWGRLDPREVLIVLACSQRKRAGGGPSPSHRDARWPQALLDARHRIRCSAHVNECQVLPAWQRYQGQFYRAAGVDAALAEASREGHVVIISGGYGLVRADELIGDYDRKLTLTDWVMPDGRNVLQEGLRAETQDCGATAVVAFVPSSTRYADVVRGARWATLKLPAYLVRAPHAGSGTLARLGHAFAAFWRGRPLDPREVCVEALP